MLHHTTKCLFNSTHNLTREVPTNTHTHIIKGKKRVKFTLEQAMKAQRGSRCIALNGVGGHHTLANLPPEKTQNPLYRRLGRPQGWYGWVQNISPPHWALIPGPSTP